MEVPSWLLGLKFEAVDRSKPWLQKITRLHQLFFPVVTCDSQVNYTNTVKFKIWIFYSTKLFLLLSLMSQNLEFHCNKFLLQIKSSAFVNQDKPSPEQLTCNSSMFLRAVSLKWGACEGLNLLSVLTCKVWKYAMDSLVGVFYTYIDLFKIRYNLFLSFPNWCVNWYGITMISYKEFLRVSGINYAWWDIVMSVEMQTWQGCWKAERDEVF